MHNRKQVRCEGRYEETTRAICPQCGDLDVMHGNAQVAIWNKPERAPLYSENYIRNCTMNFQFLI